MSIAHPLPFHDTWSRASPSFDSMCCDVDCDRHPSTGPLPAAATPVSAPPPSVSTPPPSPVPRPDAAAGQWLASLLLDLERHTGAFAAMRVPALLKSGGVDAVLAEVALLEGDYARRLYLTELLSSGTRLDDATLARVVRTAGGAIASDYELRTTLSAVAAAPAFGPAAMAAFVDAAGTIQSDYERRTTLVALLDGPRAPTPAIVRGMLASARAIKSDYEKATTLLAVQEHAPVDAAVADEYFATAATIGSDYELRRAMTPLLQWRDLDEKTLAAAFTAAQRMTSDYERAELLIVALRGRQVERGPARVALDAAIDGMKTSYERGRVLDAARRGRGADQSP